MKETIVGWGSGNKGVGRTEIGGYITYMAGVRVVFFGGFISWGGWVSLSVGFESFGYGCMH